MNMNMKMNRTLTTLTLTACLVFVGITPAMSQVGQTVEVNVDRANVQSGRDVVGTVSRGDRYQVLKVADPWLQIEIEDNGVTKRGWIQRAHVEILKAEQKESDQQLLQINSSKVAVKSGANVVGYAFQGEIYPVLETNGPWYKISLSQSPPQAGWVLEKDFQLRPKQFAAPGQNGLVPSSVHEAKVSVDWQAERVTATAKVHIETNNKAHLHRTDDISPLSHNASLKQSGDSITVTTDVRHLLDVLAEGTRSIWIVEGDASQSKAHRIDLEVLQLGKDVRFQKYETFAEGIVLHLPAVGLLPGFVLEFAEADDVPTESDLVPLSDQPGAVPRLSDVHHSKNKRRDEIRVVLPFANGPDEKRTYYFRVRNPEGSLSNLMRVSRSGDEVGSTASQEAEPQPLFVDASVPVPSVELLDVSEAIEIVEESGLKAVVVDPDTLKPSKVEDDSEAVILSQGISEDDNALIGQEILLSTSSSELDTDLGAEDQLILVEGSEQADPDDDLGLVELLPSNDDPEIGDPGGLDAITGIDSGIDNGTGMDVGTGIDDLSGLDSLGTGPDDQEITLDTDPGVDIDPGRPPSDGLAAAVLKLLIIALEQLLDWKDAPGMIGSAVNGAISATDAQLKQGVQVDHQVSTSLLGRIFDIVDTRLGLKLSAMDKSAAITSWQSKHPGQVTFTDVDRNRDGHLADDVVIELLVWLHENGKLDATSLATIDVDATGKLIARVADKPQIPSIDHLKDLPINLPGSLKWPEASQASTRRLPSTPPVPQGKPIESDGSGPDLVQIPDLGESRKVADVYPILRGRGLKVSTADRSFPTDLVQNSTPPPLTWVTPRTAVTLQVLRQVPDVRKLSLTDARAELKRWEFEAAVSNDARGSDVVLVQIPQSPRYMPVHQKVQLATAVQVPNVIDKTKQDAVATLLTAGLGAKWNTPKSFDDDKVAGQRPRPGRLLKRDEKIVLDLHVKVPDLNGLRLANAMSRLESKGLQFAVSNRHARNTDMVRGQQPAAQKYVAYGSQVTLGPIHGIVPDVRGKQLDQASLVMNRAGFSVSYNRSQLVEQDLVTNQAPTPGNELERGKRVVLDGRVRVPGAQGDSVGRRIARIQNAPGNLQTQVAASNYRDNDPVVGMNHRAGSLVYPRTRIIVTPGVVVPRLTGQSPRNVEGLLQRAGLGVGDVRTVPQETTNNSLVERTLLARQNPGPGVYSRDQVIRVDLLFHEYQLATRTMPQVTDLSSVDAVGRLHRLGLNVRVVIIEVAEVGGRTHLIQEVARALREGNEYKRYTTIGQQPGAGTQVQVGQTVQIEVTKIRSY